MQEGSTYPNTNPYQNPAPAPVGAPAPTPTPDPGQPAPVVPSSGKSKTGLIIGIIIAVVVIIGVAVALILVLGNKKDDSSNSNSEASSSETKKPDDSENKPDESDPGNKPAQDNGPGILTVNYAGKAFNISKSFADTVKSAAQLYELYTITDSYDKEKITSLETFLSRSTTAENRIAYVYIYNPANQYDDAIEIRGHVSYDSTAKTQAFRELDLYEVELNAMDTNDFVISGHKLSINKTTDTEVKEMFGEPVHETKSDYTYALAFSVEGYEMTFFFNSPTEKTINFITIEIED